MMACCRVWRARGAGLSRWHYGTRRASPAAARASPAPASKPAAGLPSVTCGAPRVWGPVLSFFFFQAEDGIRDLTVTGVQTCALPISAMIEMVPVGATVVTLQLR